MYSNSLDQRSTRLKSFELREGGVSDVVIEHVKKESTGNGNPALRGGGASPAERLHALPRNSTYRQEALLD